MAADTEQKKLLRFLKRRHPDYAGLIDHWTFLEDTYYGGRDWFAPNIFRYYKEGQNEFEDRLKRAYRFNHTREVVDLVQKYIFKAEIARSWDDAPQQIQDFWENVTLSGLDIDQFMDLVSKLASIFGMVWLFTDTNRDSDVLSLADQREAGIRAYAYVVKPTDVLDMGFDDQGQLNWILVREWKRDDTDPINSSGAMIEQFRLWERDVWRVFEIRKGRGGAQIVEQVGAGINALGRVPCFPVAHVIGEHRYSAPGLINDIGYLDRAIANYLSNLDAIIQDQTFSQLTIPSQALPGGEDEDQSEKRLVEMGTKRVFTYDAEAKMAPAFISPDPRQAQIIITVVNKIIAEIYHTIGMAGERTKQDNAVGIDNSSGVAKAYDFDRVNSLLVAKAGSLENAENKLVEFIADWNDIKAPEKELVSYPDNFDVRSLFDEFTVAEKLTLIDGPEDVRREQMKQIVEKLFPALKEELKAKILAGLTSWPPKIELDPAAPTSFGKGKNPRAGNRQGQVTKTTK